MRKFTVLLIAILSASYLSAQIHLKDSAGEKVVTISSDNSKEGRFMIDAGGVEMIFASKKESKSSKISGIGTIEVGFNSLTKPDYSNYSSQAGDFMDLNNARSIYFGWNIFHLSASLNRAGNLKVSTALGMVWRDYVFDRDITLQKLDGMVVPVPIDPSHKKSKLNTYSMYIPVVLTFSIKDYFISAGVYGDLLLGSHTKTKFPKEKMRNPYTQPFQGGLTARAGYKNLYIFSNYGLTELFKNGKGPQTHTLTIGFGLGM